MRLLQGLFILNSLITCAFAQAKSLRLYAWPESAQNHHLFGMISIMPDEEGGYNTKWSSYTPPIIDSDELVRIGFYDANGAWHGSVASGSVFGQKVDRNILIYVDFKGDIYHVGITAEEIPDPAKTKIKVKKGDKKAKEAAKLAKKAEWKDGQTFISVIVDSEPPLPTLNKPVVLNAEGRVESPEGQEKTFLQKYWWAIGLFLIVNVMAGAGGGEESK